jgi:hypothetical protein
MDGSDGEHAKFQPGVCAWFFVRLPPSRERFLTVIRNGELALAEALLRKGWPQYPGMYQVAMKAGNREAYNWLVAQGFPGHVPWPRLI